MQPDVTLITCTGGRDAALNLLKGYIARQSFKGRIEWIITNDCENQPFFEFPENIAIGQYIPIKPYWQEGDRTLGRNLLIALEQVLSDKILFIEDDDWYHPDYVSVMTELLNTFHITGEGLAKYYNVRHRLWKIFDNKNHASLAQTGIRACYRKNMEEIFLRNERYMDIPLWGISDNKQVFVKKGLSVGIKGMTGRAGIGDGHENGLRLYAENSDQDMTVLREWIGDDCTKYRKYQSANS